MFQKIDYIISFFEKPADISRDKLFISFPKNQQMFQEIDYIISFSEKPTDVSRDRLFISFPKNQLMFQEIDYLFHSRKTCWRFKR